MVKVIAGTGDGIPVTLLVRRPTFLDGFLQTVVKVLVLAAFADFCLVVEFDLVDQEPGKTLSLVVNVLILGRHRWSGWSNRCLYRSHFRANHGSRLTSRRRGGSRVTRRECRRMCSEGVVESGSRCSRHL